VLVLALCLVVSIITSTAHASACDVENPVSIDRTFNIIVVCAFRFLCNATLCHVCELERFQTVETRMWANAQRDGRPAEYRWRPLLNAAKFG